LNWVIPLVAVEKPTREPASRDGLPAAASGADGDERDAAAASSGAEKATLSLVLPPLATMGINYSPLCITNSLLGFVGKLLSII
jgi:hypothetical protein